MNILVLNAGSSSLKFRVFRMDHLIPIDQPEEVLAGGEIERIGHSDAKLTLSSGGEKVSTEAVGAESISSAVSVVLRRLDSIGIDAVGHRVVHGGPRFLEPTFVDDRVLAEIHDLTELAPLHNPSGLAGIETILRERPKVQNFTVFDTAFHQKMPQVAKTYALPSELTHRLGLRRYGFHGISYRYVSERLQVLVPQSTRHILCHLGSGASVCAVLEGQSVDTSMGFTPMEGLVMGTRSGDIDPGLLLHLERTANMTRDQIDDLLNHRSGLLGLSGISDDVRDLEAEGSEVAHLALDIFAYRVCKYIGAYSAVLGGVDALVFTGGIGEFSSATRSRVCRKLEYLALSLDEDKNQTATGHQPVEIGLQRAKVWIIPTDEERQIAREGYSLLVGA